MADTKLPALTELTSLADGDWLYIVDVSDTTDDATGSSRKVKVLRFARTDGTAATITGGGTLALAGYTLTLGNTGTLDLNNTTFDVTGGGTLALGGFTLTVPATGSAALLGTAQTFTETQTINAPGTGESQEWQYSGTNRAVMRQKSNENKLFLNNYDNGVNAGPSIYIGYNSNATTPSAGYMRLANRGGTIYCIWPDVNGNLRIGTTDPTSANDTSGNSLALKSEMLGQTIPMVVAQTSQTTTSTTYVTTPNSFTFLNATNIPSSLKVYLYVRLQSDNASNAVYARLYNDTDSVAITGSEVSTSSASITWVNTGDIRANLASGLKRYAIQYKTTTAIYNCYLTNALLVITT